MYVSVTRTLCVHLWENPLSENPAPTLLAWQPLTTPSVTRLQGASYLVRFPDLLADASVFFKVRRGPCPLHILISKDPKSSALEIEPLTTPSVTCLQGALYLNR